MIFNSRQSESTSDVGDLPSGDRAMGFKRAVATPVRIGDLLLEQQLITEEQLQEALQRQSQDGHRQLLGEVLIKLGFVTEEQVARTLAEVYGVPFGRVGPKVVDPKIIEMLPREFLEKNLVLPMFLIEGKLTLAVHEPTNLFLIEEVERLTDRPVQIVAATAKDIRATLQAYLPAANVFVIDDIVDDLETDDLQVVEDEITELAPDQGADESPVIKLVNYLVFSAANEGASDIHIEPGDGVLRVRFRVDGRLFEKMKPPYQMHAAVASRIKIMAGLDISERRQPQDGGITVMLNKQPIDLRVSTMPGRFGEKVVIRIVDKRHTMASIEKIGFAFEMLEKWRQVAAASNGIVLVTGPTGSGKSTTLYATLAEINSDELNISTVEDPIEQNMAGLNQFQVNNKAGFTFATALRSLLRQDPDTIMVGEIRDLETAQIATQAALTGHLVFSTLHTNDAPSAITRLFNIGIEPYLVAASVRGVLAQRLLRKICTHCKEPLSRDAKVNKSLARLNDAGASIETLYQGAGCDKCRNTGYAGRIGIFELFTPDDEVLDSISRGVSLQELRSLCQVGRYVTLRDDGLEKVKAGLTSLEELLAATSGL